MKFRYFWCLLAYAAGFASAAAADSLTAGFADPPDSTKPWVYWYWITDNISREGITKDLEAMKRVGIGEAFIGNIYLEDVRKGEVKALTEAWWGMVEHAIREGGRIGVNIGMFNCPGWSQSGGPWVKPDQAMRYLASTERHITGPARFEGKLPAPKEPFQDLAVLAFPAPRGDRDTVAGHSPKVICTPSADHPERLADGKMDQPFMFPKGANPLTIDIELADHFIAQSLVLHPANTAFSAHCELQVANEPGEFRSVRTFPVDRSNTSIGVGFMPHGPVAISFPALPGKHFRLVFTRVQGDAGLLEIELTAARRVERYIEKQLAKMHPTPLPMWDTYLWPTQPDVAAAGPDLTPAKVINLTDKLEPDGTLRWDAPPGEWVVLRTGMTPTGMRNAPASPEGQGLEIDKMNRAAAQAHFDAFIGTLLRRMPASERKAFKHVIADSYEMGSQNWTDGFRELFQARCGYDPLPWLPTLTGRIVNSAEESDRFLWDLRRLVADQVAYAYVGGLRDACHQHGLKLWLENYGHWGFPAEFLQYGGQADQVGGEFWATGDLGSIELRAAASAAHIYGKPIVSAEAFTSTVLFESTPWSLKKRGDWAMTEGINHWVLHVYVHQPWEDRRPGVNAWFSTEFNRHNTWFDPGRAWIEYYRRCHFLLQQGRHVADVAYFIGEDTPKMTGIRKPELPAGYNYDYINAEVIQQRLQVKEGRWVLPDGMSYRLLVLPELETMRPEVLAKLRELVRAGGALYGPPPSRSPSLRDFPGGDDQVKRVAREIWGECDGKKVKQTRFGKGLVFHGVELPVVLRQLEVAPDFTTTDPKHILWTHRSSDNADLYFICNQADRRITPHLSFRVNGKLPEVWNPENGRIETPAVYDSTPAGIRLPLDLEARGSRFIVFREPDRASQAVTEVSKDGQTVLTAAPGTTTALASGETKSDAVNTFTMMGWVLPDSPIALPKEANTGVHLQHARNDAVWAAHGQSLFSDPNHACAGISVGINGVAVYEHSGNYFAPLLVHAAPLTRWTHVAVVYQDGQPALYLDGKMVHRGLKSRFVVHSGVSAGQASPAGTFKGEKSEFTETGRALTATEIQELARAKPDTTVGLSLPAVQLTRDTKGRTILETTSPGAYNVTFNNGRKHAFQLRELPVTVNLSQDWTARFPANLDVPEQISLDTLQSLTRHENEAVRHFSGTVVYAREFELTPAQLAEGRHAWLDLGRVESLAEVRLNGQNLGVLWKPPYILNVTGTAKPGRNALEIRVTGTWRNRLIGDAKYPKGFGPSGGSENLQFKPFLAVDLKIRPDEGLAPFGLIGPVRIGFSQTIPIEAQ